MVEIQFEDDSKPYFAIKGELKTIVDTGKGLADWYSGFVKGALAVPDVQTPLETIPDMVAKVIEGVPTEFASLTGMDLIKMTKSIGDCGKKIKKLAEDLLKEMKALIKNLADLKQAAKDFYAAIEDGSIIEKANKVLKDKKIASVKESYEHAYAAIEAPKAEGGGCACCTIM